MTTEEAQWFKKYQFKYLMWFRIAVGVGILLALLLLTRECNHNKDMVAMTDFQDALNDTLKVTRNKLGQSNGQILVLQTEKAEDFLKIQSKDSTITKLQQLVKDNKGALKPGGSVTIIGSETGIDISVPVIPPTVDPVTGDTIYKPSPFNLKGWVWGTITSRPDTTDINLKVRNEYNLVIGFEKRNWYSLKKDIPFADVTSLNPYTEITTLRTYQVKMPDSKQIHIGVGVFYGIGKDFEPSPFIGAGVMWSPKIF